MQSFMQGCLFKVFVRDKRRDKGRLVLVVHKVPSTLLTYEVSLHS
jgi:hypothetical protein